MKSKYLAALLTMAAGLTISTEAVATVVVEWQQGDNAANIQQAIDSGDSEIIIPDVDKTWVVGQPIVADQPHQKIIFKPGVVVKAKEGAFKGKTDSLLNVQADNVTLSGYGATLKMQKDDYDNPNLYKPSQFRHNIKIRGARNFVVEGLVLRDSGGDGILITHGLHEKNSVPERKFSSGIVRDVIANNNYRQGISVVSAKDLLVENSTFKNTSGVKPSAGVDIEPDHDWQKLVNIQFKNNKFINNNRHGIQIALGKYHGSNVSNVSINFDGCKSIDNQEYGIKIQGNNPGVNAGKGVKGKITFKDCVVRNSGEHGIWMRNDQLDPSQTYKVTFENTKVIDAAQKAGEFYPVLLWNTVQPGGIHNIDFGNDFLIVDNKKRPALHTNFLAKKHGLSNISGVIKVNNSLQQPTDLGENLTNVTLQIK